jgi:hypothetical protein
MAAAAEAEPAVTVTDALDDSARAVIADGCGWRGWCMPWVRRNSLADG